MKTVQIQATANKGKDNEISATTTYDFGESLQENVATFGEDVVNTSFEKEAVIYLQGVMRAELNKGKTPEQVSEYMKTVKPGVKRAATAVDPKAAIKAAMAGMTAAERKAYIAELMGG